MQIFNLKNQQCFLKNGIRHKMQLFSSYKFFVRILVMQKRRLQISTNFYQQNFCRQTHKMIMLFNKKKEIGDCQNS